MASKMFLRDLSSNDDIENAEVVAGVVRALAKRKFKSICCKKWKPTDQIYAYSLNSSCTNSSGKSSSLGFACGSLILQQPLA